MTYKCTRKTIMSHLSQKIIHVINIINKSELSWCFLNPKSNTSWCPLVPTPRIRNTPPVQQHLQTLHVSSYSQSTPSLRNHAWILLNPLLWTPPCPGERAETPSMWQASSSSAVPQVGYPLKANPRNVTSSHHRETYGDIGNIPHLCYGSGLHRILFDQTSHMTLTMEFQGSSIFYLPLLPTIKH